MQKQRSKERRMGNRLLAAILVLVMVLSCLPISALAAYNERTETNTPNRDEALKNGKVFQLAINGDDVVGAKLTGDYEFYSLIHTAGTNQFANGGTESGSTYRWLRGDSRMGEYTAIEGATGREYTLTEADVGKYIRFEVTPRAQQQDGSITTGETVRSEPVGPVMTEEEFASINNMFSKTASIYENDAKIAEAVEQKFGDATYFVCDATAGIATIHGSTYASVGGVKQSMEGITPTMDENDKVWVSEQFINEILGVSYDMNGASTVDLEQVAADLGKEIWIGTEDLAEGGNYRTTPLAKGLVILSDEKLDIDTNRDRDILNEAANSLYVLRSTEEQMEWFRAAKYGMFIHWDPSSITRVEISWDRQSLRPGDIGGDPNRFNGGVADPQYDSLYMDFNPTEWDADALMKYAKENGIQYVVFTAKHHGAFANFQTEYRQDFSIANTPYQDGNGDIVGSLAEAAHKYGLKLGFYYSPRDWSNPYYYTEEHYRYMEYYLGQLTELCSNYGGLDILWFDSIGQRNGAAMGYSDAMSAWDARTILRRIRQMQPDIIINNRYVASLASYNDTPYDVMGDWNTPETRLSTFDDSRPWESCMCPDASGSHWSDHADVTQYISYEKALQYLINNTCNDGNLLMDYGPTASGAMRDEVKAIYDGVGDWLDIYGESIFNTRGGPYKNTNSWGGSTYRINDDGTCTMYLHVSPLLLNCHQTTGNTLTIPVAPDGRTYDLENAYLLSDKAKVSIVEQDGNYVITLPEGETWSTIDTVIVLQESLEAAAQSALATTEQLLADVDPMLSAQAAALKALADALRADPTAEALKALNAANDIFALQKDVVANMAVLKKLIDGATVGNNPWECSISQYNRAVLVYENAVQMIDNNEADADAISLMNENLETQIQQMSQSMDDNVVVFAPGNARLTSGSSITLTSAATYAEIRYTTDGSDPTAESTLYTGPITPSDGVLTLKAAAFFDGEAVSSVSTQTYLVGDMENLALQKTATCSNYYQNMAQYAGSAAFDGNGGTRWATDDGTSSAWIQVDLGEVKTFNALSLQEYLLSGENTRIQSMDILYSTDGVSWEKALSGVSGGADVLHKFEPVSARYVKLDMTACTNPTVYEIQIGTVTEATLTTDYLNLEVETTAYSAGASIAVAAYGMVDGTYVDSSMPDSGISFHVEGDATVEGGMLKIGADATEEISVYATLGDLRSQTVTLSAAGGESNIALGAKAKAGTEYNATYGGAMAIDGSMDTRWASTGAVTSGSGYKTEYDITELQGNYYYKVVLEEYVEPQEGKSRCDYIEVQAKDETGNWVTVAKWTQDAGADGCEYTSDLTCADKTFTKNGVTCTSTDGSTVFQYNDVGWYNDQYGYYRCTHTLTFDKVSGSEIRLRFTDAADNNLEVSFYEIQVFGGTEQQQVIKPTEIVLASGSLALDAGATGTIEATVHPLYTTNPALNYESSDTNVATVDGDGTVHAVAPGSAVITVTSQADPSIKATCYVSVRDTEKTAYPITVTAQGGTVTVKEQEYGGLRVLVTVQPESGKQLTSATLNGEPLEIVKGSTMFSFVMPEAAAALNVVCEEAGTSVAVTGVKLDQTNASLKIGETLQLNATVEPADATNQKVLWSSDHPEIASVDASGKVTAVAAGTATITVTTEDGGFTATCTVTVTENHTHSMTYTEAEEPTCTEDGNEEYWYCEGCDKYFSDAEGKTEIDLSDTVIDALGHDYSDKWSSDETNHWHECSRCHDKADVDAHVPGEPATETEPQLCTVCGYEIAPPTGHITHTPGEEWLYDETQHWHKCTGCNLKMDEAAHSGGTATCTEQAICEVCGAPYGELAEHTYEWAYDDSQHWKVCEGCGEIDGSTYAAHTWVEDEERSGEKTVWYTCECGAEKSESRVTATPTYILKAEQSEGGNISPESKAVSRGGELTFTITPDAGYHIADVLVDGKSVGAVSEYTFKNVSGHHTITAQFTNGTAPVETVKGFSDVTVNDWFADAVEYAVDNGLMNGTSASTFSPKGDTTRGMIVTILYRLAGSPGVESDGATWWSDARVWAMEEGISDGTNMDGKITREQLAAMLYRYAGSEEVKGDLSAFADADKVSDWATDALIWATANEIVTGKTGNVLDPDAGATRAETAAMLMRFGQIEEA